MGKRSLHFKLFCTALIGSIVMALLLGSIAYIAYGSSIKENTALIDAIVESNTKAVEVDWASDGRWRSRSPALPQGYSNSIWTARQPMH